MDRAIQTGSAGRPVGRRIPWRRRPCGSPSVGWRSAATWPRSRGLGGSVLFAHGSGSRHSPRNPRVAERLQRGLGTLRWTCSPPTRRRSTGATASSASTSGCSPGACSAPSG